MVTPLRRLQLITLLMLWCLTPGYSFAAESADHETLTITAILSGDSDEYQTVFRSLSDNLLEATEKHIDISSLSIDEYIARRDEARDLVVAVGTAASRTAVRYGEKTPVLSIFIPEKNFTDLPVKATTRITAIVIDQPLSRYLELCVLILSDQRKKLGIFYNGNKQVRDLLSREVSAKHFNPVLEIVNEPITARNITHVINASDAILLLPGFADISPQRAKWLLYMAYRDRIPVIAFSEAYVKSGALASISTDPEDIGRQAATFIADLLSRPGPLEINQSDRGKVHYPDNFSVHVNRKIADQLDITIPDTEILQDKIGNTANTIRDTSIHAD